MGEAATPEQRISLVRARIQRAAIANGRPASDVTIVAVTKNVGLPAIRGAFALGLSDFGENRVQEARSKVPEAGIQARWHMIGHLQTNKVRHALQLFSLLHSLDRAELAAEIQRQCDRMGVICHVLVQVNVSGEMSKSGVSPEDTGALFVSLRPYDRIHVDGLMTIAPYCDDPEETRPVFRKLFQMARAIEEKGYERTRMRHLSMGMSADNEEAVQEGASMVRIGTAIFGPRQPNITA